MSNTDLKKKLVDIGDQLALILSKDKESFTLYKIAKQLYIINQQLLEYSEDGDYIDDCIDHIVDECAESINDNRLLELEHNIKDLQCAIQEIRQSISSLANTVFDHDTFLKPINDLLKKHSAYINAIKKKLSIS